MTTLSPAATMDQAEAPRRSVSWAAAGCVADVAHALRTDPATGLTEAEVSRRRERYGPNAVESHRARFLPVLWHQLRSPLLALLLVAATASYFVGERSDAIIIGVIVALSVGLGLRQRVPRREGGRGAARSAPP